MVMQVFAVLLWGTTVVACLQEPRGRGKKVKQASMDDGLSARQKSRIVSKATISTSESDSDSNQLKIASGWVVTKCKEVCWYST
jgi:hypothetical protein